MGGHDILLAEMTERAIAPERERELNRRLLIREAKAARQARPERQPGSAGSRRQPLSCAMPQARRCRSAG